MLDIRIKYCKDNCEKLFYYIKWALRQINHKKIV